MTALQERVQQVSPAPALVVDVYGAMQMLRLGRCSVLALADRGRTAAAALRPARGVRGRRRRGAGRAAAPVGQRLGAAGRSGRHLPDQSRRSGGVAAQVAHDPGQLTAWPGSNPRTGIVGFEASLR